MTENEIPESCTTKAKHFWKDFYRSPCFLLKAISLTFILGLAIFGLYRIVTSAFYYFDEPLSYFDPERLGQLGDFLGGTLNPIFGFATVCLLLWSVFIQKKELTLTRDELKKSSTALENQVKLATDEYNRKQLESILDRKKILYDEIINREFFEINVISNDPKKYPSEERIKSIKELIQTQKKSQHIVDKAPLPTIINIVNDIISKPQSTPEMLERQKIFLSFQKQTSELVDLYLEVLRITNINSIQDHIENDASLIINSARLIHIFTSNDAESKNSMFRDQKSALREKAKKSLKEN